MNRIRAGFCRVRNPFNAAQVSRIELSPDAVDAIVFWTRNPGPLLPHLPELDRRGFRSVFLVTVTGLPSELEPHAPTIPTALAAIERLAAGIGPDRLAWRYDPILVSNHTGFEWHLDTLKKLAGRLAGKVNRCITSLADFYRKTGRHLATLHASGWEFDEHPEIRTAFPDFLERAAAILRGYGITPTTCSEDDPRLAAAGFVPGACLDRDWLAGLFGLSLPDTHDTGQRPLCRCLPSKDVGAVDSCRHGCLYCYATRSFETASHRPHDPLAEML